jgi:hypothetical protein
VPIPPGESLNVEAVPEKMRGNLGEEHGTECVGGSSSQDGGVLESAGGSGFWRACARSHVVKFEGGIGGGLGVTGKKGRKGKKDRMATLGNGEGGEYGFTPPKWTI